VDQAIADTEGILSAFSALLRIAQIESGSRKSGFGSVNLSHVFQTIAETYMPVAEDQGQFLTAKIDPGITTLGDRELLTQMLANLVENAIRHNAPGTKIGITLERTRRGELGAVADNGVGIPIESRAKVFQRFHRLEASRTTAGSGLGLSLVAAVADLHDIVIALEDNRPGLRVVIEFGPTEGKPR
jgi:signal transduction histidine kinase